MDCYAVQRPGRAGAPRFLSSVNERRDQRGSPKHSQLGDPEMVVMRGRRESNAERRSQGKKSKLPTNSPLAKDWLPLAPSFLPRPPSPATPAPALIRMQHHNGLFLILAGSLLFSFPFCWASWAVIFPCVSSITDTTSLVQIKMHLRIIKKGPSFLPSLSFPAATPQHKTFVSGQEH